METSGDAAIEQLFQNWSEAVRRGDAQALRDLMTEDAEFWTQGTAPLKGPEETIARMAAFSQGYDLHQVFERSEVVVSGDLAFVRGVEVNRAVPRDGAPPMEVRQRAFSILFRGPDGAWRFARGMTNQPPEK
jgi:uncharacterized protein (TIGR02246 family)